MCLTDDQVTETASSFIEMKEQFRHNLLSRTMRLDKNKEVTFTESDILVSVYDEDHFRHCLILQGWRQMSDSEFLDKLMNGNWRRSLYQNSALRLDAMLRHYREMPEGKKKDEYFDQMVRDNVCVGHHDVFWTISGVSIDDGIRKEMRRRGFSFD